MSQSIFECLETINFQAR